MHIELDCPSGLKGRMRGLKVKDEKLFADRRLVESGRLITTLLNSCWEETLDPGPYGTDFNWDKACSADRTFAILQLRIASYGSKYSFTITCDNEACRKGYVWELDLNELDVKELSGEGRHHLQTVEPIKVKVGENMFLCRLLNGADEAYISKMASKDRSIATQLQLARCIVSIEGVKAKSEKEIFDALADLNVCLADELRDKLDELAGGVETAIATDCEVCGSEQQVDLPFEASFFSGRKRFAPSKRKSGLTKYST